MPFKAGIQFSLEGIAVICPCKGVIDHHRKQIYSAFLLHKLVEMRAAPAELRLDQVQLPLADHSVK